MFWATCAVLFSFVAVAVVALWVCVRDEIEQRTRRKRYRAGLCVSCGEPLQEPYEFESKCCKCLVRRKRGES